MGKKESDDETIRIVYINSNQTQFIRNIPEGEYYCVIAYGKEWKESPKRNGKRQGTFTKNALYEKGTDILDFNTIPIEGGFNVPNFSLSLDLLPNGTLYNGDQEAQDNINANAFNEF